ncbi:hypothetical protein HPB50_010552 [Hyalomma asiaticum]|uniref:Uncharacterized protein n=1 Tax=Hyalomma asiaticum TaxID=266040 RepID=A0ACB7TFN8_HYAAI|nr:hypothetical protein HPB50_010552 [Hyalomma asiaticum]
MKVKKQIHGLSALSAESGGERGLLRAPETSGALGGHGSGALRTEPGMARRKALDPRARGPSSLFLLSEDNLLRRYTKFFIEWPYPFLSLVNGVLEQERASS